MESFSDTVDQIIAIDPDRIAVFSYAHVPWMKKQQGSFARFLPEGREKFRIWSRAIQKLTETGYRYIGMDHFARPTDELCRSFFAVAAFTPAITRASWSLGGRPGGLDLKRLGVLEIIYSSSS